MTDGSDDNWKRDFGTKSPWQSIGEVTADLVETIRRNTSEKIPTRTNGDYRANHLGNHRTGPARLNHLPDNGRALEPTQSRLDGRHHRPPGASPSPRPQPAFCETIGPPGVLARGHFHRSWGSEKGVPLVSKKVRPRAVGSIRLLFRRRRKCP